MKLLKNGPEGRDRAFTVDFSVEGSSRASKVVDVNMLDIPDTNFICVLASL